MSVVKNTISAPKRTRKSKNSIAPAVGTVEPVAEQSGVIEPTEPVEQEPTEPVIEEAKVETQTEVEVGGETISLDDIVEIDLGRVTKQTPLYLVFEIDGKQRWLAKDRFASWVVDAEGTAHVTLDRKQVKAWKLTSVA